MFSILKLLNSYFEQGELNNILNKVKDVISENEALTEQTKQGTIVSDTSDQSDSGSTDVNMYKSHLKGRHEKIPLSGPSIIFESRISELEAQLAQAEIDIKNLSQENNQNKQKLAYDVDASSNDKGASEVFMRQIETLQRFVK